MKLWKKLLIWVLVSLTFQMAILWFIDSIYLQGRDEAIEVTEYSKSVKIPDSKKIKIPETLQTIKISHDSRFAGFIENGALRITDLTGQKQDEIIHRENENILYFDWLPDRNMVIYALAVEIDGKRFTSIETFDAGTAVTRKYPRIDCENRLEGIFGIELSPYTNTVYVIFETASESKVIYKYDIVDELSYVTTVDDIETVRHMMLSDTLIFQNSKGRIFTLDGKTIWDSSEGYHGKSAVLLGTDINGQVYIGEADEKEHITSIDFGKLKDGYTYEYRNIGLKEPISAENVEVSPDGKIYIVSPNQNRVFDAAGGASANYPGNFIQVAGSYIVSYQKNKLMFTAIPGLH